jgi:hypothetical protein
MYETVHTGLPVVEHGVVPNHMVRRSSQPNAFQSTVEASKTTAAAGYCWFSELCKCAPYEPIDEREINDPTLLTQHGRFYTQDRYPDPELFVTAGVLARKFHTDYLLVHPMGWIAWEKPTPGCTHIGDDETAFNYLELDSAATRWHSFVGRCTRTFRMR